jgi:DNA-binding MarR family transcriptional regulator
MEYSFNSSLGNLSNSISKLLGKTLMHKLSEKEIDITPNEWFLISMLYQKKICTQNEVVENMGQNKVKVTRIVDKLERKKLLSRSNSNTDLRYKNLELTKLGIEQYHKILPIAKKTIETAIAGFSDNDYEIFLEFCNRINQNLKSVEGKN